MASASAGSRVVLHVDMDAFYAAVETRENPGLDGKPVVVGADPRKHPRGVVLTASYEARRYGLRSAMSCVEALRRCPEAIFVPPHFELYGRVSGEIMATLRGFADRLEPSGIEEGYLDVTNRCDGNFSRDQEVARGLKAAVPSRPRSRRGRSRRADRPTGVHQHGDDVREGPRHVRRGLAGTRGAREIAPRAAPPREVRLPDGHAQGAILELRDAHPVAQPEDPHDRLGSDLDPEPDDAQGGPRTGPEGAPHRRATLEPEGARGAAGHPREMVDDSA